MVHSHISRKPPVRHEVKQYRRSSGKIVHTYKRGSGKAEHVSPKIRSVRLGVTAHISPYHVLPNHVLPDHVLPSGNIVSPKNFTDPILVTETIDVNGNPLTITNVPRPDVITPVTVPDSTSHHAPKPVVPFVPYTGPTDTKAQIMLAIKTLQYERKQITLALRPYRLAVSNAPNATARKEAQVIYQAKMKEVAPLMKATSEKWRALASKYGDAYDDEPSTYAHAEDTAGTPTPGITASEDKSGMTSNTSPKGAVVNSSYSKNKII
jgi:hypothetical protein